MQGILLKAHPRGVSLDFSTKGAGVELDFQNAYVHALTSKGSAVFEPSRGTGLRADIRSGSITSANGARHASNFAALSTMRFLRDQVPPPEFSQLQILPVKLVRQRLELDMIALDAAGNPVKFAAHVPT